MPGVPLPVLLPLVDRLDALARAYIALSWLSECSAEVPADRVGFVMMPLDDAMEVLVADFHALVARTRESDQRCEGDARRLGET